MCAAIKHNIKSIVKMYKQENMCFLILLLLLDLPSFSLSEYSAERFTEAQVVAQVTFDAFLNMFMMCTHSHVPSQQFKSDNVKGFINYPARTTVGSGTKMTTNRKFFANIVATRKFKEMLDKDVEEIKSSLIKKMKYCDNIVMSQNMIQDFYDREVDQTKL